MAEPGRNGIGLLADRLVRFAYMPIIQGLLL